MSEEAYAAHGSLIRSLEISETYPGLPDPCVDRPTLMSVLSDLMSREYDVIFLDGPEDSGKTTALAQFAARCEQQVICLFLRPITEFTYDPVRIRYDLCNQISWQLFGRQIAEEDQADPAHLRFLLLRLERKARQDRRPYFFVVDALGDIPKDAQAIRSAIIEMLPIGVNAFRFLVSGSPESTGISKFKHLRSRTQQITVFGLDETSKLFEGLATKEQIEEIHKTCGGVPGRLASVRRLILSGVNPDQLIESLPDHAPGVLDIEWQQLKIENPNVELLLSIVAHTPEIATKTILQTLLRIDSDSLRNLVHSIPCLHIEPQGERVVFVSETFRRYAAKRLAHKESDALERAVAHLLEAATPADAFRTLPEYLERRGDVSGLISYFNTRTVSDALRASRSIALLTARLGRAAKLALSSGKSEAAIRYILQGAALRGVLNRRGKQAQVEAAFVIHGEQAALAVAAEAFSEEQRLHLLAIIARRQKASGLRVDSQIIDEITRLAESIDWTELKDQAFKIATALLPVLPEVGLRTLERSVEREGDANAVDIAIAAAFLRAAFRRDASSYRRELLEYAFEKSRSQNLKKVFATVSGISPAESASELFSNVDRMSNTSERVLLLRLWLEQRPTHDEAVEVARRLIDVMMNDSRYAPKASDFSVVMMVVAKNRVVGEGERLVRVVEAQLAQLKLASPTVDYVHLLCSLTLARAAIGIADPVLPLFDEAVDLENISDDGARAACFGWLMWLCSRLESEFQIKDEWGIESHARSHLDSTVSRILDSTAEQRDAFRSLVRPLCECQLDYLESVVQRVNTAERRDGLYEDIITQLISRVGDSTEAKQALGHVRRLFEKITDELTRRDVALTVASWCAAQIAEKKLEPSELGDFEDFVEIIADPDDRSVTLADFYRALPVSERSGARGKAIADAVDRYWQATSNLADQVDCAFTIAARLHSVDAKAAEKYYREGERLAADTMGLVASAASAVRLAVKLMARAVAAAERASAAIQSDWDGLWSFAKWLPAKGEYAQVAAFAALLVGRVKRDKAQVIVEEHVKPGLRELLNDLRQNPAQVESFVIACAPALWLHHSTSIDEFLGGLSWRARDEAFRLIVQFLLHGRIPYEPWKPQHRRSSRLTYEVATDVLSLLQRIQGDCLFAECLEELTSALRDRSSDARINRNQKAEIIRRLRQLSNEKLPEKKYGIRHEGYLLLAEANILAAEGEQSYQAWDQLIERAEKLPNLADSIFVLASFIKLIPSRHGGLRQKAFESAAKSLPTLHLLEDRMDRCVHLANEAREFYATRCKELLGKVLEESLGAESPSIDRRRQDFLDLMYQLDREAAAAFASATDTDPVRQRARLELREQLEDLKAARQLREPEKVEATAEMLAVSRLADICWDELGYINATRVSSRTFIQNIKLIESCQHASMAQTYRVVSYALEATAARYESTPHGAEYTRALLFAVSEACELALIAARVTARESKDSGTSGMQDQLALPVAAMVRVGGRDAALEQIELWIKNSQSVYVKICDPYFRATDMELLAIFGRQLPKAEISLITSAKAVSAGSASYAEEFEVEWRRIPAEFRPPYCQIVIAGTAKSQLFGIHNRWIILEDVGIDLGTSVGSLGMDRSHVLTRLDPTTRAKCEEEIDEYLLMRCKYWKQERVIYKSFTLLADE